MYSYDFLKCTLQYFPRTAWSWSLTFLIYRLWENPKTSSAAKIHSVVILSFVQSLPSLCFWIKIVWGKLLLGKKEMLQGKKWGRKKKNFTNAYKHQREILPALKGFPSEHLWSLSAFSDEIQESLRLNDWPRVKMPACGGVGLRIPIYRLIALKWCLSSEHSQLFPPCHIWKPGYSKGDAASVHLSSLSAHPQASGQE